MSRTKLLAVLTLTAALGACASSDGTIRSDHLPTILSEVRGHPEKRAAGEAACERSITRGSSDFPFQLFFAGLFDVPDADGGSAFCSAIVEGVISSNLTEADLDAFKLPSAVRGKGPLGLLARKLLIAHERLQGQQAEHRPAVTAGTSG
jgi:hypothetical protein